MTELSFRKTECIANPSKASQCVGQMICRFDLPISGFGGGRSRDTGLSIFAGTKNGVMLGIKYRWSSPPDIATTTLTMTCPVASNAETVETCEKMTVRLGHWQALIWPELQLGQPEATVQLAYSSTLTPGAQASHAEAKTQTGKIVTISEASTKPVSPALSRPHLDIHAALRLLANMAPAELTIALVPTQLNAQQLRNAAQLLAAERQRQYQTETDQDASHWLSALIADGRALAIDISVAFAVPADPCLVEILKYTLFGPQNKVPDAAGLHNMWNINGPFPDLVKQPPKRVPAPLNLSRTEKEGGTFHLGQSLVEGSAVNLGGLDRARHLYVIGATGTGKSTLLLNQIHQDMQAGEGIILIDPHGDLADDAYKLVPVARQHELQWCDFSDPATVPSVNILEIIGPHAANQRSIVANQLVNLFKSILYRTLPDAFGPMFEQYFRNGLMLLMAGSGGQASLMDFDRVFHDTRYRNQLLENCDDAKVTEFWREIAPNVSDNADHSLANLTPYITSKLAQLTGNPVVRQMLCGNGPRLDLPAVMNEGRILLIKLAKGAIGELDTKLIATILSMRILQAGMMRGNLPPNQRRVCRLIFDEFQNADGQPLATMLAEARKYGISLTLANQSLGQVTGRHGFDDAGDAALANAANLVVFRVGAQDARRLSAWLEPEISWTDLMRLPDFEAVVRLLAQGRPAPPFRLAANSPPAAVD